MRSPFRWLAVRAFPVVAAIVFLAPADASAALFDGNRLEIGWTGSTPFADYANTGMGPARNTYTAPMTQAGGFTTSNYASSTDMRTWVTDTNVRIVNGSKVVDGVESFFVGAAQTKNRR